MEWMGLAIFGTFDKELNFFHFLGYKDSGFHSNNGNIYFVGNRYAIKDGSRLNLLRDEVKSRFKCEVTDEKEEQKMPETFPDPKINEKFFQGVKKLKIDYSIDGEDRLMRCHGQSTHDIYYLQTRKFTRIPDIILWPVNHDEVVEIVKLANEFNVVVIPYGGGTNVTESTSCPQNEIERCISVLDTSQMNRMLWLDKTNLVARFEAGIVGQDLERILSSEGMTMGHEPDSIEFSTLGGWVATRASGMKKNVYGNIEDLVLQVKMVTT
jgi:alkyldihydroxyacetonephosphate synthase